MNQVDKLKKLSNLSYFDKNTLSQLVEVSNNSLYANIKRWIGAGRLLQLKKGLYVTEQFISKLSDKTAYAEFLANRLREPSYISMEYTLQKYGILTEAVYGITSITLKSKRTYTNKITVYSYSGISEKLFTGYEIRSKSNLSICEATKIKALFDFLYLKLFRISDIDRKLIKELRLNLEEITKKDLSEFKQYCELAGAAKYRMLPKIIGEERDLQRTGKNRR